MNRIITTLFLGAMLATGLPAHADESAALRAERTSLQQEQQTIAAQIEAKQRELEQLKSLPSPELDEFREAEAAVAQVRRELAADKSPENEARLKNAEFKLTLAERKYSKANADVAALTDAIAALQGRQAAAKRTETELSQRIATVERITKQRQEQALAAKQAKDRELAQSQREAEQAQREAEAAQREVERLRALLAAKEKQGKAAKPQAAVAKPATAAANTESVPQAAAKPVALTVTTPATPTAAADKAGSRRLTTQQEVATALREMEKRIASETKQRGRRDLNEIIFAKRIENGKEINSERITLQALGGEQYRGLKRLAAGEYQLVAGFQSWPLTISASDATDSMVMLLDRSGETSNILIYNDRLE